MTLNSTSLLLERSLEEFQGKVLIANPEDTFPLVLFQQQTTQVYTWCQSKTVYDELKRRGMPEEQLAFNATLPETFPTDFDHVIVYQPKAKELLSYLLAASLPSLVIKGSIWLVGENKSGVRSSYKKLENHLTNVGKVDSAKHCLLYVGSKDEVSPAFQFDDWTKIWTQEIAGQSLTLVSIPGVFGHGKIDVGTNLLLGYLKAHRFMSQVDDSRILDFGCGDGIIALWLSLHTGARVTALDDSALALKATDLTFKANNIGEKVEIIGSNGLKEIKGRFNYIVSNPPFHSGVSTDYSIAEQFFMSVRQHLTLNGELFVVANDFLRYPSLLDVALGSHTRLLREQGFALYHGRQKKP